MGCVGSSNSKSSSWVCKDCSCPDDVEPMEMPSSLVARANIRSPPFASRARASSSSPTSPSTPMNTRQSLRRPAPEAEGVYQNPNNQLSIPSRRNLPLVLGSYPTTREQNPSHSIDCQRRRKLLQRRHMQMLAHYQPIVLVPHLHLHSTLPAPHLHLRRYSGCDNHHPLPHHAMRRSALYHGQGYIIAHHNHHHHVNYQ